jgi:hypothetical protein
MLVDLPFFAPIAYNIAGGNEMTICKMCANLRLTIEADCCAATPVIGTDYRTGEPACSTDLILLNKGKCTYYTKATMWKRLLDGLSI